MAKKVGLAGKDAEEDAKIDMIADHISDHMEGEDLTEPYTSSYFNVLSKVYNILMGMCAGFGPCFVAAVSSFCQALPSAKTCRLVRGFVRLCAG